MKQDTKEKLMAGGVVLAGLYILSRDKDEATGGFGGGGGIPLLPGDTEDAAEGDTIINYILPEPIEEMPIWDMEEPVTKKMTYAPSIIPTYPLEYYTSGGVSELSVAATPAQKTKSVMELQHYADPFAYLFSGRRDAPADLTGIVDSKKDLATEASTESTVSTIGRTQEGIATVDVFNWDFQDAANNVGLWLLGAPQPPKPSGVIDTAAAIGKKADAKSGSSDSGLGKSYSVTEAKTRAITKAASYGITSHAGRSRGGGGTYYASSNRTVYGGSKKTTSAALSSETKEKNTMREKSGYGGYI